MRVVWLMLLPMGCSGPGNDDDPVGDDDDDVVGDDDDDDVVGDDDDDTVTDCAPGVGVDVIDHMVTPIEGTPLGVGVSVTLAEGAGAWVACTLETAPDPWQQLVSFRTAWSYVGDGSFPGSGWETVGFDDSAWATGSGPFGFAETVQTELDPGTGFPPNGAYFRRSFEFDAASASALEVMVRRDDGIAVYLNGTEVLRDNLPSGPLTVDTPAVEGLSGSDEDTPFRTTLDPTLLVTGTNWVAVELHQYPGSSDAGFDLRLTAAIPDATEEIHLVESEAFGEVHELSLLGLLGGASYACEAHSNCGGASVSFTVQTNDFVEAAPSLSSHEGTGDPGWGAYTLFNHQRACDEDDETHRLFIVDPEGRMRWNYLMEGIRGTNTMDIESAWLGEGQILWGGGEDPDGMPHIVHLDHTEVHRAGFPGADDADYHHDVEMLPDGQILGITASAVTPDGVEYWAGFSLTQHDPATQQLTWEWNAQDAYDAGQLPVDGSGDPYHPNSMAWVDDVDGEGVYVTLLTTDQIIRIDKDSGDVTWKLGRGGDFALVDNSGAPLTDDFWMDGMHAIDVFGDHFLVYENGYGDGRTEVLEFALDIPNRVATLRWSWTEFGWYEPVWGDADELPNGDILIAMCHAECIGGASPHLGAFVEVDRQTDEVIWRLDYMDKDDSSYRSERIDGCEMFGNSRYCPDVAARLTEIGFTP